MTKILVGYDGSNESRDAATTALELASAMRASLLVATVMEPLDLIATEGLVLASENASAEQRRVCDELLRTVKSELEPKGVRVETTVATGNPAAELARLADNPEVTLAVVGHRGRSGLTRLLLGSVADRLVQICNKPVLVVR